MEKMYRNLISKGLLNEKDPFDKEIVKLAKKRKIKIGVVELKGERLRK